MGDESKLTLAECLKQAQQAFNERRYEQALALYRQAMAQQPEHVTAQTGSASALRELGRFDEAEELLAALLEKMPDAVAGWTGRGHVAARRGRREEAVAHFRRALELQPDHASLPVQLAAQLRELGRLDEAEAVLETFLERLPEAAVGWESRGYVAARRGRREDAVAHFRRALELQPEHSSLPVQLAGQLRELGRLDEAEAVLAAFLERVPDSAMAWEARGYVAVRQGRRDAGAQCFERALALRPDHPSLPVQLAGQLRELGRLAEAEAMLAAFLERVPGDAGAWIGRGYVAARQGQREEAVAHFQRALTLQPDHPTLPAQLAAQLRELGRLDEADTVLKALLARRPGAVDGWIGLAQVAGRRGDHEQAVTHYRHALTLQPDHPTLPATIAKAEQALQRAREEAARAADAAAAQAFEQACRQAEQFTDTGRLDEAQAVLDALQPRTPQEAQQRGLQLARVACGRLDGAWAAELLRSFLASGGVDAVAQAEAHRQLALLALARGDAPAAGEELAAALALDLQTTDRQPGGAADALVHALWGEGQRHPQVVQALRQAQSLAPAERLPVLARLLTGTPEHQGTALAWLVAAREAGVWAKSQPLSLLRRKPGVPPRVVQYVGAHGQDEAVAQAGRSWAERSGMKYQAFDDAQAEAFIAAECRAEVLQAWRAAMHPAVRADLFRLAWLWTRGGVVPDAGVPCRGEVAAWLPRRFGVVLVQAFPGFVGHGLAAAAQGHPFVGAALEMVVRNVLCRQGDCAALVSGAGALSLAFCWYCAPSLAQGRLEPGVRVFGVAELLPHVGLPLATAAGPADERPLFRPEPAATLAPVAA